jgi:hypothetical protein
LKSQHSQGQQPIKSTQPANTKSSGKKLVTEGGNFLVNFFNFFFFMTPDGQYLIWNPTLKYGLLPTSQEWNRLHTGCNVPVVALTMEEHLAAQTIYDTLKLDRYHGLSLLQRSLAIVHRNLYLRKQKEEKVLPAKKFTVIKKKKFVPVKAVQSKEIVPFDPKKRSSKKDKVKIIDIKHSKRELDVDVPVPINARKDGKKLVVYGDFKNSTTLEHARGFENLRKLNFAEN